MPERMYKMAIVGAGYFSQFHLDAWHRLPNVEIAALCDQDAAKMKEAAIKYGISSSYEKLEDMLADQSLDFVDVITPPHTHLAICEQLAQAGLHIICQKPLSPDMTEAQKMAQLPEKYGVRFMVHENFRFQPWYREIKCILEKGILGKKIHQISIKTRMGDGWQKDAYLSRQPYFRTMPRLLIYETGIHFLDVFRYLGGELDSVYAQLSQRNPDIFGEDAAFLHLKFANGASAIWDASRYHEANYSNPRFTFGELSLDAEGGSLRLYPDGKLTVQLLGKIEEIWPYPFENKGFAGDCVYATQKHFVDCLRERKPFETDIQTYMENLFVQEAVYRSHDLNQAVSISDVKTIVEN